MRHLAVGGLILITVSVVGCVHPAVAQGICAEREIIIEGLASRYGEAPVSRGLAGDTTLVELFTSEQSGSWTILATQSSGLTCVVAAGSGWENTQPVPAGDDT